jgi:outer membrane lipoprotein-sorting protein
MNGTSEKMNSILFYMKRNFIFLFLFIPLISSAQTADEMAKELENLYSRGAGTSISFTLDGDKNSLTFANTSAKFRIDNSTDLIISDGATIWHYGKKKKEVVIDKVDAKESTLSNVGELIKFSTNYSGVLTKKKAGYELALTPSQNISKIMESIGGVSRLTFSFTKSKKGISISKITTRSAKGDIAAGNVKIQSLKKVDEKLFTFSPSKGIKVTDLRD